MRSGLATATLGALIGAACGGGTHPPPTRAAPAFACRARIASYAAGAPSHAQSADARGVQIDCAEEGPRIKHWRVDRAGTHQEEARSLTPGEFEAVWRQIDGTGWARLGDCAADAAAGAGNGSANESAAESKDPPDPIYLFSIQDDQHQVSFQCQSPVMPPPYQDIVAPLDRAAQPRAAQPRAAQPRAALVRASDEKAPR